MKLTKTKLLWEILRNVERYTNGFFLTLNLNKHLHGFLQKDRYFFLKDKSDHESAWIKDSVMGNCTF